MQLHHETAQSELVTQAYQSACQGLRLGVISIKDFGQSMLQAQKVLKKDDKRLYAWVREVTGCTKSDATLNNWKRLAKFWTEKVEPKFKAAESAGRVFTLQDALVLIKGKSRPGRQKKHKDKSAPLSGQSEAQPNGGSHLTLLRHEERQNPTEPGDDQPAGGRKKDSEDGSQGEGKPNAPELPLPEVEEGGQQEHPNAVPTMEEKPIHVQPPFDLPGKDRLAAVFAQNGPAPTPIQLMTNLVIPNLKKVAAVDVSDNDVPFLVNTIKEALGLIETLKQKYAIS